MHRQLFRMKAANITLDPRLPFPESVGGIVPGPATTRKGYQGIECFFLAGGSTIIDSLSIIRGITIPLTGDWQWATGRPISFYHVT